MSIWRRREISAAVFLWAGVAVCSGCDVYVRKKERQLRGSRRCQWVIWGNRLFANDHLFAVDDVEAGVADL